MELSKKSTIYMGAKESYCTQCAQREAKLSESQMADVQSFFTDFSEMSPAKKTSVLALLRMLGQKSSGEIEALQVILKERKAKSSKVKKPSTSETEEETLLNEPKKKTKAKTSKTFIAKTEWEGALPGEGDLKLIDIHCFSDLLIDKNTLSEEYQNACAPNFEIMISLLFNVLQKGLTIFSPSGEEERMFPLKNDGILITATGKGPLTPDFKSLTSPSAVTRLLPILPLPWIIELTFHDSAGNFHLMKKPEEAKAGRVVGMLPNGNEIELRPNLFQPSGGGFPQTVRVDLRIPKS
jgi:hypothetical protein